MQTPRQAVSLEEQIEQWRSYLRRRQAVHPIDVAKLEHQLREEVAGLTRAGLANDEAFLVAVKRISTVDPFSREFAREHADRIWKQLIPSDAGARRAGARKDAIVAFCFAVLAAAAIKVPALFGIQTKDDAGFYARNASFFVLPCLIGYFVWKRQLAVSTVCWLAGAFVAAGVFDDMCGV